MPKQLRRFDLREQLELKWCFFLPFCNKTYILCAVTAETRPGMSRRRFIGLAATTGATAVVTVGGLAVTNMLGFGQPGGGCGCN